MHINIKTSNRKELWLKALVDSQCTHTRINKQFVTNFIQLVSPQLVD